MSTIALTSLYKNIINHLALNWRSGLSIAFVSVPLSLSFAIASGAHPIMGLITSAWAGLAAALIGGSNYNVISPAGAFAGILTVVALQYGVAAIPVVTVIAGLVMALGYFFNVQRFLKFIPGSAIFGFTIGIALIIAGTQINSALGLTHTTVHESILMNIFESIKNIGSLDIASTLIFVTFLGLLFLLSKLITKIPSIIIMTPLGIILGYMISKEIVAGNVITLQKAYGDLGSNLINIPTLDFSWGFIIPAVTIAVVGILETMLSAKVADQSTGTRHNEKREMLGLACANVVSGLTGGMPATGVLGPTVLNINSGAQSRYSAVIKAVVVGLVIVLLFDVFKFLPMPVIAAMLFFVAISMVEARKFLLYYQHDRFSLGVAILVAGITVYKDPALGILVGSVLGLLFFAEKYSRGLYESVHNSRIHPEKLYSSSTEKQFATDARYDIVMYSFKGVLSHLSTDAHRDRLSSVGESVDHVILRLREISYIDIDGVQGLDGIIDQLSNMNIQVYITGMHEYVEKKLRRHSVHYEAFKENGFLFAKTRNALQHLGVPLPHEEKGTNLE